jgi:hypothetical protein
MTIRPPSALRPLQAAGPPCGGGAMVCFAVALFLALALAQAASARSHPALEESPAHAVPSLLGSLPPGIEQIGQEADADEVQLAMLEVGPMLHALALGEADHVPPAWRTSAIKSAVWVAVFVLAVSTSAAMVERRAQRRRSLWRRRAAELYQ